LEVLEQLVETVVPLLLQHCQQLGEVVAEVAILQIKHLHLAEAEEEVPNITEQRQELLEQLVKGSQVALDLRQVQLVVAVERPRLVPIRQTH
jgi:hypothetical protein